MYPVDPLENEWRLRELAKDTINRLATLTAQSMRDYVKYLYYKRAALLGFSQKQARAFIR